MIWHQLNKQLLSSKSGLFQLLNGLEYGQSEIFEQRFGQISTTRYRQRIITDFSTLQKQKNRKIRYYRPFMKVWFFVHYYELNDIRPAGKEKYKMYSTIELQSQFTILSKQYKKRSTLDMISEPVRSGNNLFNKFWIFWNGSKIGPRKNQSRQNITICKKSKVRKNR